MEIAWLLSNFHGIHGEYPNPPSVFHRNGNDGNTMERREEILTGADYIVIAKQYPMT